ncbi:hypothetical protein ACH4E8_34540 [Streptomyces sp. NPDC017979]|uniref:hypothetical protein n=1 Tax=Streptomyces sp. NPDC017979 TaxID=3365024 RepID=UPI00379F7D89
MNDDNLYDRAAVVLGQDECGIRWPYGLTPPPPRLRHADPAEYDERALRARARQEVVVAWAERYGLRLSEAGCCPLWLRRDNNQPCRPRYEDGGPCTRYGTPHLDSGWMDHQLAWLKDARPAVLTAAPYEVDERDESRLAYWERTDARLRVARGAGWYGFGTEQIVMWRSDLLTDVLPAKLSVGTVGTNRSNRS